MIFPKEEPNSWTTRASDVNPNTIIENSFLQEFFRHMLADVHEGSISNLGQKLNFAAEDEKEMKAMAERLFSVVEDISLKDILDKLNVYLLEKSPSFADGELSQLLQMKFSNFPQAYPTYKSNQMLLVDVKIKADAERIGNMPTKMKQMLESLQQRSGECPIAQRLSNYGGDSFNFLVVYFGYYDFSLAKNTHFEQQSINLFGRTLKLRINAIFVSKVALMETFKTICKVPNLDQIDETLIQLYELKRSKAQAKKKRRQEIELRKSKKQNKMKEEGFKQNIGYKAVLGITAVGVAVAIGKFFS